MRPADEDEDEDHRARFAVRCVLDLGDGLFEERITLWRAEDADRAFELAQAEARRHADALSTADRPVRSAGFAQSYRLVDDPETDGAEVFSLVRTSDLSTDAYLDRFFATGDEHEQRD